MKIGPGAWDFNLLILWVSKCELAVEEREGERRERGKGLYVD